jgi:hypothetical protein
VIPPLSASQTGAAGIKAALKNNATATEVEEESIGGPELNCIL